MAGANNFTPADDYGEEEDYEEIPATELNADKPTPPFTSLHQLPNLDSIYIDIEPDAALHDSGSLVIPPLSPNRFRPLPPEPDKASGDTVSNS